MNTAPIGHEDSGHRGWSAGEREPHPIQPRATDHDSSNVFPLRLCHRQWILKPETLNNITVELRPHHSQPRADPDPRRPHPAYDDTGNSAHKLPSAAPVKSIESHPMEGIQ